jgi:hypothetical protein
VSLSARDVFTAATDWYGGLLARVSRKGFSPFPVFVNCILCYECNMDCWFCVAKHGRLAGDYPRLDCEQWDRIFRQIPSRTILGFSGGEIFCHPEVLDILERAARGHPIVVVTNGLAVDAAVSEALAALGSSGFWGRGLVQIGISVNEPIHDVERCRAVLDEKLELFGRLAAGRRKRGKRFPRLELKVLIRDETAPYLDMFARALERGSGVDAVTFQILTSQQFCAYLGLDPSDSHARRAARGLRDRLVAPIEFKRGAELGEAFARLEALPRAIRRDIHFLPSLRPRELLAHYDSGMDLARLSCTNPWMHMMIDPFGVAFLCINPEGVDLKKVSVRRAWNDARFRSFRTELRAKGIFNHCAGCCFLRYR